MSFRCEKCKEVAQRPNKIVVERKMVQHTTGGPRGGMGSQIVREERLCNACAGITVEAPIEHAEPGGAILGELSKAPLGDFLSFEEVEAFAQK